MKYEVIKDTEDLYVLVINGVVVMISRNIEAITGEIVDDAQNRKINPKRTYEPAILDVDLPVKEDESPQTVTNPEMVETLGPLFML